MEPRKSSHRQADLFAVEEPPTPMPPERRQRLVPLIGALLVETALTTPSRERGNEDHG